ncbi:MAG: DUF1249 domain-containing protein [Gammaproteobacteria bacterium]|nr:DUF1249 domain-containing protein [Gammaproteobacteria bacterium]
MRMPCYPWLLKPLFEGRPTVGWLMDLCDENFGHLMRLSPNLREMEGLYISRHDTAMDLYLEVLEQTPYTTLIHLTYYFDLDAGQQPDPDARVRIYHDSCQAEVVELKQKALPMNTGLQRPTLEQKWKINLFLSKWLSYSVQRGHCFTLDEPAEGLQRRPASLPQVC